MLAWSEELITDVRKPEIMVVTSNLGRRAVASYSDRLANLSTLNPKLKSTGAGRYRLFPVGGMPASSLAWKTTLRKSQDAVALQQIKERGAFTYDWSWWYPSGNRPLQQYLGFTAGRWLWSVRAGLTADCKIQSGRNWSERLMYGWVAAIISALVICIIVCLSWAVNHYRDNAITYKAQRDKNARELKLAVRSVQHADASAWCCCARCKIHEGVSWC